MLRVPHTHADVDFLSRDYRLIGEPLNLIDAGSADSSALVLGAIPWVGSYLRRTYKRVTTMATGPILNLLIAKSLDLRLAVSDRERAPMAPAG
jgi:hypothetical protein